MSVLEALEPRLAPAGIVAVNLNAQGVLTLTGDADANSVAISDNGNGTWSISDVTNSGTLFRYQGNDVADLTFSAPLKNIKASLGDGADQITLQGLSLTGSVTIQDTASSVDAADQVTLLANSIQGGVKIASGGSDDVITLADNAIGGLLNIDAGQGTDQLHLGAGSYGDVKLSLGSNGSNGEETPELINFTSTTGPINIQGSLTARASTSGYSGMHFGASDFHVSGHLNLHGGGVSVGTYFNLAGGGTEIGGNFNYRGGLGNDIIEAFTGTSFTVAGRTDIRASGGENYFGFAGSDTVSFGQVHANTGQGAFTLDIMGANISLESLTVKGGGSYEGSVNIHGETVSITNDVTIENISNFSNLPPDEMLDGAYGLSIGGNESLTIGGDVTVIAKKSVDTVQINGGSGSIGHFTYLSRNYDANASISGVTVNGDVNISASGGGSSTFYLSNLVVTGDLNISSHSSTDDPFGLALDGVEIHLASILGNTSIIQRGDSMGIVSISDSTLQGSLDLHTGAGNDEVTFGSPYGGDSTNHFHGAVRILLGSGDDRLMLDTASGISANHFDSTFEARGGAGTDTYAYSAADDLFSTPPVFLSF